MIVRYQNSLQSSSQRNKITEKIEKRKNNPYFLAFLSISYSYFLTIYQSVLLKTRFIILLQISFILFNQIWAHKETIKKLSWNHKEIQYEILIVEILLNKISFYVPNSISVAWDMSGDSEFKPWNVRGFLSPGIL